MVLTDEEWEELNRLKEQELAVWQQLAYVTDRVTTSTYDAVYNPQKKET
jgi:hypothetical protein